MDITLCLRFEALKSLPVDDDYFFRKGEILVETHPESSIFRPESSTPGKHGLSLSCFSDKQKEAFLKELPPVNFKETKNYKEWYQIFKSNEL